MDFPVMIISFIALMFIICGVIIFFLHRTLISSTEGAVNRLNEEIAKAKAKENELNKKLKDADEELAKRRAEAKELAETMRSKAEEESKEERDKIINKAREESEEIIAKAQKAKDQIRAELEKEMEIKTIDRAVQLLNEVLSESGQSAFNAFLVDEFITKLKNADMSKINPDVDKVEVVVSSPLDETKKTEIQSIIKDKLNRDLSLDVNTDNAIGGGLVLKFGSMALDGSMKSLLRERGIELQEQVDAK